MMGIWNISLEDILTGSEYSPNQAVKITLPLTEVPKSGNVCVVHYKDDGSIEYIKPDVIDNNAVFATKEFSYYAVISYTDETSPFNLNKEISTNKLPIAKNNVAKNNSLITIVGLVILISGALMLAALFISRKATKKQREHSSEN